MNNNSLRSDIVARRTYHRPKSDGSFETWEEVCQRVIEHQKWLWERTKKEPLNDSELIELEELKNLMISRKALLAGRTLWLGGTDKVKQREVSNYNCSFSNIETVHDVVDLFWLLLNGCGVGFKPITGSLSGFFKPIRDIKVIRSKKTIGDSKGIETNIETVENGIWTIKIGDSGEAWAKSIGKLLAGKHPKVKKLIFDFSEIRAAGTRLEGYGWISSGDSVISEIYPKIAELLSKKAGKLLSAIDILDICNYLGVIQTGRRGAEIALLDYGHPEWEQFARAKTNYWTKGLHHRSQSNNSLVFSKRPTKGELRYLFDIIMESGGSEPGLINGVEAKKRAPWYAGGNPCNEILLANKGFCNLSEVNINAFDNLDELLRACFLIGRANYRQTLVNLDDGILQRTWHENNEFLRLCGVSITGWVTRPETTPYDMKALRNASVSGAYSMAIELDMQVPKNVTTVKPSGTLSKIMGTTEGAHKPVSRYLFNNVTFSMHDPLVKPLEKAGYKVFKNPSSPDGVVVSFPVSWETVDFGNKEGLNKESAIEQLDRYKTLMENYCEQNVSITISYSPSEVDDIIDWLYDNWDSYVGVSFIYRTDPTKTAEDLGYQYLPQEPVTKEQYEEYVSKLKPVNLVKVEGGAVQDLDELDNLECPSGVCPIR